MQNALTIAVNLIVAIIFASIGMYYVSKAEEMGRSHLNRLRTYKYFSRLDWLFLEKIWVFSLRLSGYLGIACALGLVFWTIILPIFRR